VVLELAASCRLRRHADAAPGPTVDDPTATNLDMNAKPKGMPP
jgi:hypothetical protein